MAAQGGGAGAAAGEESAWRCSIGGGKLPRSSAARFAEALDWFRPLAEAGDARAMYNAYVCCLRLAVVCGDNPEAALHHAEAGRWLRGAVALAEPKALNALGVAAWDGDPRMGVARNRDEARRLHAAADAAGLLESVQAPRPAEKPGST
jgi:TPR repeat protein